MEGDEITRWEDGGFVWRWEGAGRSGFVAVEDPSRECAAALGEDAGRFKSDDGTAAMRIVRRIVKMGRLFRMGVKADEGRFPGLKEEIREGKRAGGFGGRPLLVVAAHRAKEPRRV